MSPDDPRTDPDRLVETREETLDAVVEFARALRAAGAEVPASAATDAARALAAVGLTERTRVRAATRATLVSRREDLGTFDELFEGFWTALRGAGRDPPPILEDLADAAQPLAEAATEGQSGLDAAGAGADRDHGDPETAHGERTSVASGSTGSGEEGEHAELARYSPVGRSERVSRVAGKGEGLAASVAALTGALASLPGRRRERATAGAFVDARRALRASLATGGVVASLPEAEPADSDVRGVVLVDVSGSVLDSVDRSFLLAWLRLLVDGWRSTRVFFFDTDLREVTDAFDERTVGDVADALAEAETAWGGGTRIGHALSSVREEYPGAVDRRTVVLVVSDGLERGSVEELERSAAWLGRRARLLCWLNPLAASPEYEPVARGMAAALPAVDGLFAFAGPDDVAELARQLDRYDRTRLGYEYDPRPTGDPATDGGVAPGPRPGAKTHPERTNRRH